MSFGRNATIVSALPVISMKWLCVFVQFACNCPGVLAHKYVLVLEYRSCDKYGRD